jgi:light-regulated signal transduction histidine kinase (bacteriophytochrome)
MPIDSDPDRAARLLRKMHPVFSHDLPNQLVAMQGLLQLLKQEEALPAGSVARDQLDRLERVAHRTAGMVHFLKEMGRLGSYETHIEEVSLLSLLREVKVDLQQQAPQTTFEFALGQATSLSADSRLLRLALVEIVRCLVERTGWERASIHVTATGVSLDGAVKCLAPLAAGRRQSSAEPIARRLEIVLAQELLAVWGAELAALREGAEQSEFRVLLPQA